MIYELSSSEDLPVSLDAARHVLRVDFDDDDMQINDLILSETRRYEAFCRRIIRRSRWRAVFPGWHAAMEVRLDSVRQVLDVSYVAADGAACSLPRDAWQAEIMTGVGAVVRLAGSFLPPQLADLTWPVRVDLDAGLDPYFPGAEPGSVHFSDHQNILHMVKQIYDHDTPLTDLQMRERFAGRRHLW